jgi:hypothetical protein
MQSHVDSATHKVAMANVAPVYHALLQIMTITNIACINSPFSFFLPTPPPDIPYQTGTP